MKVKSNFWANLKRVFSFRTQNEKTSNQDVEEVKLLEKIKNKQTESKNHSCWDNRQMFRFWLF
ncbi:MAG: hypothetical protein BWY04_00869 [candidate division CPR1 bacterium ADurb.Bin160]|uniref:Uncharacterized protein n=1 Tax=candidate division CPR1 bacterium ADurb.Bin160 TaxID=1852826 RepID=A0A1V5ZME1_9BACT|nr:MAG: hypothetical protein BWY04_00869 [candidate division CPR1 bacterium ADurb.Bin160]